jgi:hypothetical protein
MSRVSHKVVSGRTISLLAFMVIALAVVCLATQAKAESPVINSPSTNVFFRYGLGPVSSGYSNITQVYHGQSGFENTKSKRYGGLEVHKSKCSCQKVVTLRLAKGEHITKAEIDYRLTTGVQVVVKWYGKGQVPIHAYVESSEGSAKAVLVFVIVGVHSRYLPDQPKQPQKSEKVVEEES